MRNGIRKRKLGIGQGRFQGGEQWGKRRERREAIGLEEQGHIVLIDAPKEKHTQRIKTKKKQGATTNESLILEK